MTRHLTTDERAALSVILFYALVTRCNPAAGIWLAGWTEDHFHWSHKLHKV